jgi:hypothetical protein
MNLFIKNNFGYRIFFCVIFIFIFAFTSNAQTTNTITVKNDFVLEPGKVEVFANPGESVTKTITVTNRASSKVSFKIEVEDFIGSNDENMPVILLGEEKSPYSFKDNVVPEVKTFSLESNGSITVPIKINIPVNAQPGGFYTSILVSNQPSVDSENQSTGAEGKTKIISRVGTLFFVRVNGVAKESGSLEDLKVISPTKENPDIYKFNILFKNDGNVHLVPYGWVTVTNIFGKVIGKVPVDAYFSMPKSMRYREVEWNQSPVLGRFVATVDLNRGYGSDLVDTKSVSFWIIPWKVAIVALVVLLIISFGLFTFFKKFKLVAKQ